MDREALLRLAQQASQTIADYTERISRQRERVEQLKPSGESDALQRAQRSLDQLIERQSRKERALIRIQGKLMFSDRA